MMINRRNDKNIAPLFLLCRKGVISSGRNLSTIMVDRILVWLDVIFRSALSSWPHTTGPLSVRPSVRPYWPEYICGFNGQDIWYLWVKFDLWVKPTSKRPHFPIEIYYGRLPSAFGLNPKGTPEGPSVRGKTSIGGCYGFFWTHNGEISWRPKWLGHCGFNSQVTDGS